MQLSRNCDSCCICFLHGTTNEDGAVPAPLKSCAEQVGLIRSRMNSSSLYLDLSPTSAFIHAIEHDSPLHRAHHLILATLPNSRRNQTQRPTMAIRLSDFPTQRPLPPAAHPPTAQSTQPRRSLPPRQRRLLRSRRRSRHPPR